MHVSREAGLGMWFARPRVHLLCLPIQTDVAALLQLTGVEFIATHYSEGREIHNEAYGVRANSDDTRCSFATTVHSATPQAQN